MAPQRTISCAHHRRLAYHGRPLIMGVLNVTPDSFSDGGAYRGLRAAVARGVQMAEEGADLIDVGGQSTRPGSRGVSEREELRRVVPVVSRLAQRLRIPISIDTSKAAVAARAIAHGASLINDVTALTGDPGMAATAARSGAAVILMHMRGRPRTMQRAPRYRDVARDIAEALMRRVEEAEAAGIERRRLLIDPGLGFGKTVAHNLSLMRQLERFVSLGVPVVIGPSRKSFIGRLLDAEVQERLAGTLACVARAQQAGVHMVRVHDVKPAAQLVRMLDAIERPHAAGRQR